MGSGGRGRGSKFSRRFVFVRVVASSHAAQFLGRVLVVLVGNDGERWVLDSSRVEFHDTCRIEKQVGSIAVGFQKVRQHVVIPQPETELVPMAEPQRGGYGAFAHTGFHPGVEDRGVVQDGYAAHRVAGVIAGHLPATAERHDTRVCMVALRCAAVQRADVPAGVLHVWFLWLVSP